MAIVHNGFSSLSYSHAKPTFDLAWMTAVSLPETHGHQCFCFWALVFLRLSRFFPFFSLHLYLTPFAFHLIGRAFAPSLHAFFRFSYCLASAAFFSYSLYTVFVPDTWNSIVVELDTYSFEFVEKLTRWRTTGEVAFKFESRRINAPRPLSLVPPLHSRQENVLCRTQKNG